VDDRSGGEVDVPNGHMVGAKKAPASKARAKRSTALIRKGKEA
jgi:hypothetical protein